MVERGCKFGKSIAPISYRLESSPIHVGGEILQRPPVADAYAVDSHILEHQLTNGRRQVKPAKDADLIDAPTNGCYLNCLAEIRASYKFEDVIDAS